jgi:hypothetical protein
LGIEKQSVFLSIQISTDLNRIDKLKIYLSSNQFLKNLFINLKAFLKDFVILLGCFGFIIKNNKDIK